MDLDLGGGTAQSVMFCTGPRYLCRTLSHGTVLLQGEFLTKFVCLANVQLLVISFQPPTLWCAFRSPLTFASLL